MNMQIRATPHNANRVEFDRISQAIEPKRTQSRTAIGTNQLGRQHPVYLVDEVRGEKGGREPPTSLDENRRQSFERKTLESLDQIDMPAVGGRDLEDPRGMRPPSARPFTTQDPGWRIEAWIEKPSGFRDAQPAVDQHSNGRTNDLSTAPYIEGGIVCHRRIRPHHDGITRVTQFVYEFARRRARDPARFPIRQRDPTIQRRRQFERYVGAPAFADRNKPAMLPAAVLRKNARPNFDTETTESTNSTTAHLGVWILATHYDPPNASLSNRFGARAGSADKIAGLERDSHRSPAKCSGTVLSPDGFDRDDFGMRAAGGLSRAASENAIPTKDDRTDARIGKYAPVSARCGPKRETNHLLVSARNRRARRTTHLRVPSDLTAASPVFRSNPWPPLASSEKKAS
jgi:hypothetical protein